MREYPPPEVVRTLYSPSEIAARIGELARAITHDYEGKTPVLVSVLKGSFIFAADLARALAAPVRIEFLGVRSYGSGTVSTGAVQITQDLTHPIEGQEILVVEDIVDTGLTLAYILSLIKARGAANVRVCSLLDKPSRRRVDVPVDYIGFTVGDAFVVGYGLDCAEQYRNLPGLCELLEVSQGA
ncbi:MAG TPA: hypoxanthine phosphoribosyltransferase [Polyangiaceae bacterium]|nr:hypoxanthine phosphoribosyltransferase [Polyangiaceae bacterium]